MSKELSHERYSTARLELGMPPMNETEEGHELAVDMQTIGAIAVSSEVEAARAVGLHQEDIKVPNPITPKMLGRKIVVSFEKGNGSLIRREQDETAVDADAALRELEAELGQLAETGDAAANRAYLSKKLSSSRNRHYDVVLSPNFDFILNGMDIPPFLSMIKDENGIYKDASWSEWLRVASDEQLVNFSQWYAEQLKMCLDPEVRPGVEESLKQNYLELARAAIEQGWIDEKYEKELQKRVGDTQIVFFSPFGSSPDEFGGQAWRGTLFLPVGVGEHISTHEFGHIFAGLSLKKTSKYLGVRPNALGRVPVAAEQIFTIINEGFNEHMTVALRQGSFAIVRPSDREKTGLSEPDDASKAYGLYREVFGALITGPQRGDSLSQAEARELTDIMIRRDFTAFADFVSKGWGGQDMIRQAYSLLTGMETGNVTVSRFNDETGKAAEAILAMLADSAPVSSAA